MGNINWQKLAKIYNECAGRGSSLRLDKQGDLVVVYFDSLPKSLQIKLEENAIGLCALLRRVNSPPCYFGVIQLGTFKVDGCYPTRDLALQAMDTWANRYPHRRHQVTRIHMENPQVQADKYFLPACWANDSNLPELER